MRGDGIARLDWRIDGLGPGSLEVDLARGARLRRLRSADHDLLVPPTDAPFRDGLFLMAPYAGRVSRARFTWQGADVELPRNAPPHSAHGLVATTAWSNPSPGTFTTALDQRWPFGGSAVIRIEPRPSGVRLDARVGGSDRAMPTAIGWHPWFVRRLAGVEGIVDWDPPLVYGSQGDITTRSLIPRDPGITTWTAPATGQDPLIVWPGVVAIRLASAAARCWVVHETPDAICVEPQTAPGDALNAGDAVIVAPGQWTAVDLELTLIPQPRSGSAASAGRAARAGRRTPAHHPVRSVRS